MATSFQNFTIPIGQNPSSGWAGLGDNLNSAVNGMGDALARQAAIPQQLQLAQAQEAMKAQFDLWTKLQDPLAREMMIGRLGAMGASVRGLDSTVNGLPSIGEMLKGNPYAAMVPNMMFNPQSNQNQPSYGSSAPIIGGQQNSAMNLNPLNNGNPVQGQSQSDFAQPTVKMGVFGQMPPELTNIPESARVKTAEQYASDLGKQKADSVQTVARDTANLGMLKGAFDSLMTKYDQASKEGFAGNQYSAWIGNEISKGNPIAGLLPNVSQDGLQFGAPKGLAGTAGFKAIRNEIKVKMQPMLSQQFGKEGSTRIMDALLDLSEQEIGDLNNPREVVSERAKATLENFNRIMDSGVQYANAIGIAPTDVSKMSPDMIKAFAKGLWNNATGSGQPSSGNKIIQGGQFQQTNNYVKTGTLPDGRRVGVKSDGTTEIMSGR